MNDIRTILKQHSNHEQVSLYTRQDNTCRQDTKQ